MRADSGDGDAPLRMGIGVYGRERHDFTNDPCPADIVCMGSRKQKTSKKRSGTSVGLAQRVRAGLEGGVGTQLGRRVAKLLACGVFAAALVAGADGRLEAEELALLRAEVRGDMAAEGPGADDG